MGFEAGARKLHQANDPAPASERRRKPARTFVVMPADDRSTWKRFKDKANDLVDDAKVMMLRAKKGMEVEKTDRNPTPIPAEVAEAPLLDSGIILVPKKRAELAEKNERKEDAA